MSMQHIFIRNIKVREVLGKSIYRRSKTFFRTTINSMYAVLCSVIVSERLKMRKSNVINYWQDTISGVEFNSNVRNVNKFWGVLTTTLNKTCWDKSWKCSKFKKWLNFSNSKFSPFLPRSMLNLDKFCCQKPETLPTTLIFGESDFFTEKEIFCFVSTGLSKIVGYWYFLKKPSQIAQWY